MPNNGGSNSIDTWLVVNGTRTGKVLTAPSQINLTAAFQRDSLSHITALSPSEKRGDSGRFGLNVIGGKKYVTIRYLID